MHLLKTKEEMFKAIELDREYYNTQNEKFLKRTKDHLVEIQSYLYCLRHEQYYLSRSDKLSKALRLYWARKKNIIGNKLGFYIGCTVFEPGITIYHHGSIIINGNAHIGSGCKLHGNNCIGNNVDIGFGAVIIGNIRIADGCKIGAGAVVTKSCLHEGATIVGIPAHEILR